MAWVLLLAAGVVEIIMAMALKAAQGWTRPLPGAIGVAAALLSIYLLTRALQVLPAGTAYAVWTGIGALGVTVLGIVLHGDSASLPRLGCIALIAAGIAGLRVLEG
ncbi:quaternary ammonium compound-resistance protein SugE [Andreprevotia lacus DSM 23236]|jgi:quaternary ammonium compound-resistance protein SugE|uniref:Guanidinium exporter n=1 Tax=Andreprevotia lacus DSM 23236 TaxID=1121001 RepID=A0A1W1XZX8_9NEIS|nr:multidrug efflux SMR transporter [Andreprevotia lacus]SMC29442.1 quaternary ammonium compound-resistance protein SugE [Andreprevotia lacus DSM 23236]